MEPPIKEQGGICRLSGASVCDQSDVPVDGGCRLYRHRANVDNRLAELKHEFGFPGFWLDSF